MEEDEEFLLASVMSTVEKTITDTEPQPVVSSTPFPTSVDLTEAVQPVSCSNPELLKPSCIAVSALAQDNWACAGECESLIHKEIALNPTFIPVAKCKTTGDNEAVEKPASDQSLFTFLNFIGKGLVFIYDFIKNFDGFFL